MTILSAIGEIQRFPTSKHLVGYSGLGASIHESGETHSTGRITKHGRKELRHALVEGAWVAVGSHPFLARGIPETVSQDVGRQDDCGHSAPMVVRS